ncbi:MAG: leucine--tRNA ligase [Candidatus Microsaccharimonas sossegonensis]|uniref:Leucine--tRNA ligase n=1 Tax=Candidatus Microsaccharimonas sossegonensis TaxID=2506948 RepID=A0A4Q0AI81_9BACT|nr:MAG: leucine--tRNA ligase [Candidatus Microsaccharimonas sossegonensis]
MQRYNPSEIEPKWQKIWQDQKANEVKTEPSKQKMYVSGMFPYPSGAGMHTGHAFSWAVVDAIARFHHQHGENVLNPIGWDTFGLPAENYAIKTGTSPAAATATNIINFKNQFIRIGVSIDWSREINTSDPSYYKWTQWVFTKLFERGLAYQKESLQWWCPVDKTVLANEQVEGGRCWRCGSLVEKKSMKQWFFKITEYADSLLDEIEDLDWPQKIKTAQINWIGKSEGAEIDFLISETASHRESVGLLAPADSLAADVSSTKKSISVFSTRPDTMFGATFLVLAPEHPLALQLGTGEFKESLKEYVRSAVKKSEIERTNDTKEKTGVFTGSYAINPINDEKVPIWVADYVLGGYGTGAVMGVPAHDERDYAFAEKFHLPIVEVIEKPADLEEEIYHGEGTLINSSEFDGMQSSQAREEIVAVLEEKKLGSAKTTYKMRDWLISRQRYWGAPIPIIHCPDHGAVAVPENQLPVMLPEIEDYAPKGDGLSALARAEEWVNTPCPNCGKPAKRETDTMDGYACSSWYLLRYADPKNAERAWDPEIINYWNPVDVYVGGDHAIAHLLYVRFWTHVFYDMKLVNFKEPVKKLIYHGYINAEDGTKMSKSKGNVVDPLDVIDSGYGADALRTYLLFMGPIELDASWSTKGVAGVYRFLNRIWTLTQQYLESDKTSNVNDQKLAVALNKTIKKVTNDIRRQSFNTAIAGLMEFVNDLYKLKLDGFSEKGWRDALGALTQMIAVFAPHMADELWTQLGGQGLVQKASWPKWDDSLIVEDMVTIAVQVNGKLRGEVTVEKHADTEDIKALALAHENVAKFVREQKPTKIIYVPGRLVSIVL